jgi:uncharacterized protein
MATSAIVRTDEHHQLAAFSQRPRLHPTISPRHLPSFVSHSIIMLPSRQGTSTVVGLLQRSAPSFGRTQNTRRRLLSGWNQRGHDLTSESLAFGGGSRPKVVLQGYGPSGFDVFNMVKKMDARQVSNGTLHMHVSLMICMPTSNQPLLPMYHLSLSSFLSSACSYVRTQGSIIAFSDACFLWKVERPADLTLESLAPVLLHHPGMEILLLGCHGNPPPLEMNRIRLALQERNIALEKSRIANAMGTFNILNAEDRHVVVALIVDPDEEE